MALLGNPRQTPPVPGFCYTQMETQTRMEHETLGELVDMVIAHRRYKGLTPLDPETVNVEIQRQICAQMPPGICGAEAGEDYKPFNDISRFLTLDKITSFSHAVMEWIRGGRNLVDEEEAIKRAKICLGCPFNKTIASCSCAPLWALIKSVIPAKRQIDNLHICAICGCVNSAAVLMPMSVIAESNRGRDLTFPAFCWKLSAQGL